MRGRLALATLAAAAAMAPAAFTSGGAAVSTHKNLTETSLGSQSVTNGQAPTPKGYQNTGGEFVGSAWLRLRATRQRRAGYGWTNAHAKRVARKTRNRAAFRKANR